MEYTDYKNAVRKNGNEFLVIFTLLKIDYRGITSFIEDDKIFFVGDKIYYIAKSSNFEHDLFHERECLTNNGKYVMFEMMPILQEEEVMPNDDFVYYFCVSNLWQKTTKEAFDMCSDNGLERIKIHKEWFQEAWEELHDVTISNDVRERIKNAIEVQEH